MQVDVSWAKPLWKLRALKTGVKTELKAYLFYYPMAVVMTGSSLNIFIPLSEWGVVTGQWLLGSDQGLHFPILLTFQWRHTTSFHYWNLAHIACWLRWLRSRCFFHLLFPPSSLAGFTKTKKHTKQKTLYVSEDGVGRGTRQDLVLESPLPGKLPVD